MLNQFKVKLKVLSTLTTNWLINYSYDQKMKAIKERILTMQIFLLLLELKIHIFDSILFFSLTDWSGTNDHDRVQRQLSVSSDSKLLDEDIREETRVIMRPKKPPRPKSEVFLNKQDLHPRRKRFSAFGVSTHFTVNGLFY